VIAETSSGNSPTTPSDRFNYQAPAITSISPSIGPTAGGQGVTLTGVGFYPGVGLMTVKFGDTPALDVDCPTDVLCYVGVPAGTGSAHITATLAGATSKETSKDLYTYAIFPSIASLSPYNGPVTGGTVVAVTGTNFSTAPGGTTFQFGSLAATNVTCGSSTQCTVTAPVRDASAGYLAVQITATVNEHTSIQGVGFAFGTPPVPIKPPPCKGTGCP